MILGTLNPPQPENQPTPEGSATDTLLEEFLPDLPFDEVEPVLGGPMMRLSGIKIPQLP